MAPSSFVLFISAISANASHTSAIVTSAKLNVSEADKAAMTSAKPEATERAEPRRLRNSANGINSNPASEPECAETLASRAKHASPRSFKAIAKSRRRRAKR